MDYPSIFIKLLEFGAWPAAAVLIVLLLRRELRPLIPMIRKLKAGPVEIELERVVKELAETKKVAEEAQAIVQVVAAKLDEGDEKADLEDQATQGSGAVDTLQVTAIEKQVLKAITESRFATRSITGVAKDTGLSRQVVQITYGKLIEKGLLEQTKNAEDRLRWYPSALGRIVANEA